MSRPARHRFPGKVTRLNPSDRARAESEARVAAADQAARAIIDQALADKTSVQKRDLLKAIQRAAGQAHARIEGPYLAASFLAAEAYRLCPVRPTEQEAEIARVFGRKRVGGVG